ncbi:DUF427 domain-containing protein [Candidatus Saccharibacteria bacterium]|jgi:uncharacterized protein (DUF427 family)|nr:DUF427 domain-containing protein [Candidatus Saccharibacteria bacterium]MCA9350595.1 DUF427 domain-containing protein [Candidatus Saccharibacteria bacterium]
MKAIYNSTTIAEADQKDLIYIEGNWYFPPDSLNKQYFLPSSEKTTCFWKGEASYYDVKVDDSLNSASAWYYPKPLPGAIEKVKKDFTNYVAFWRGIEVSE